MRARWLTSVSCWALCEHDSLVALLNMSPAEAQMDVFFRRVLRSSLLNLPLLSVQPRASPAGLAHVHAHVHVRVMLTALVLQVGFLTTFAILLHEIPHEVSW